MGRRSNPTKLCIQELEKTSQDPVARRLRSWKRKQGIHKKIMVVSSMEAPVPAESGKPLASTIFVPASAGLLLASGCIEYL